MTQRSPFRDFRTSFNAPVGATELVLIEPARRSGARRAMGRPEEIAAAAIWLCSDAVPFTI